MYKSTPASSQTTDKNTNHLSWFARLQRRRWLKRKAAQDYRNARGSAHRALLEQAAHRLKKRLDTSNQVLDQHNHALPRLIDERDAALHQALSRHIVETRLTEIHGIGATLQSRILSQVFRTKLDDLRSASQMIHGIGDSKQRAINLWIHRYMKDFPSLLQKEFPGKAGIVQKYASLTEKLQAEIIAVIAQQSALREVSQSVQMALEQLSSVSEKDFYQALLDPDNANPSLERYRVGVFAPWESAPEWFKRAINEEGEG